MPAGMSNKITIFDYGIRTVITLRSHDGREEQAAGKRGSARGKGSVSPGLRFTAGMKWEEEEFLHPRRSANSIESSPKAPR